MKSICSCIRPRLPFFQFAAHKQTGRKPQTLDVNQTETQLNLNVCVIEKHDKFKEMMENMNKNIKSVIKHYWRLNVNSSIIVWHFNE